MIRFKRLPKDIEKKIDNIHVYFEENPHIIFAYLYGGLSKKRHSPFRDVDIAVYVENEKRLNYLDLFSGITNFLGTDELDLTVLNTAPLSLTGRVLQSRRVLIDKNPFFRHRFESETLRKYFDFKIKEGAILKRRYGIG